VIEYVAARVDGAGGDANAVTPSLQGVRPGRHPPRPEPGRERRREHTGKISGLIFDRFGDFEGFLLDSEDGEFRFFSREKEMRDLAEGAWRERLRITVHSDEDELHRPRAVVVRDPLARFRPE
jgi:hypothetical protein